ncbi:MAG: SRPBCC family protein [Steroidobacteraceae bacterium]
MSDRLARTPADDAPLTAKAHDPDISHLGYVSTRPGEVLVGRSVTIDCPREQLYVYWRNFENLPRFMHNILRVAVIDATRSLWLVAAPAGKTVQWLSSIAVDQPGHLIAWESEEGASIRNSGMVEFKESPERRGTVVTVTLSYDPPGGSVGQLIAKLFHKEPKIQARRDLRRFKQLMETGEVSTAMSPYGSTE